MGCEIHNATGILRCETRDIFFEINSKKHIMYKPGQILMVGNRKYRITKCKLFKGCVMCKTENNIIPCITYTALSGGKFNMNRCWSDVPRDCYPKEENPSVSGK